MKVRLLLVTTLTAGIVVGAPAPANAYYEDWALAVLVHGTPFGALVLGAEAHYRETPPQRAAESPTKDCETGAPFTLQRRVDDKWTKLKSGRTNDKGKARVKVKNRSGKYRLKIPAYTTPDGNNCFAGISNVVRHRK